MQITPNVFRQVMGSFATGVTVVTTVTPDGVYGMTANAVSSVSLEPMMVLVCVDRKASTHGFIQRSRVFAINILAEDQKDLSVMFASKEDLPERAFASIPYTTAVTGSPIIPGCLAYLDCQVVGEYPGGDHTIFLAQVKWGEVLNEKSPPLIFFRSRYARLQQEPEGS